MDETNKNGYQILAPTIPERIGHALFPQAYPKRWPDPDEYPTPFGWAPGALSIDTYCKLDLLDRLRVLVSGKVVVRGITRTDVPVAKAETRGTFSVLPPWHRP